MKSVTVQNRWFEMNDTKNIASKLCLKLHTSKFITLCNKYLKWLKQLEQLK